MPTYDYRCQRCGHQFEHQQKITDASLRDCPSCQGPVMRVMSGGAGFILKRLSGCQGKAVSPACSAKQESGSCCGDDRRWGGMPRHGRAGR